MQLIFHHFFQCVASHPDTRMLFLNGTFLSDKHTCLVLRCALYLLTHHKDIFAFIMHYFLLFFFQWILEYA